MVLCGFSSLPINEQEREVYCGMFSVVSTNKWDSRASWLFAVVVGVSKTTHYNYNMNIKRTDS